MALVLDTGVLYAALDIDDPQHQACADLIGDSFEQLVIPDAVLVELDYWVRKFASADAWLSFCEDVAAGAYVLTHLDSASLLRAAQLQARYADQGIDLTDASVFVTCESLGESKVGTLDRRHFSILRAEGGGALRILPE